MAKKIFEIDQYIKECSAIIVKSQVINEKTWISLDQTIFYPESGGQPADYGFIDQVTVTDVQYLNGEIYHEITEPIDKLRVKLKLDYDRRFDHMQQHSGQHLLSAVWLELFGVDTISFHLGKDICTIDLNKEKLTADEITAVENKVAEYIFENRTVESYLLPYDEVPEDKVVKVKDKPDFIRFVEIDGLDTSTCCGTHVSMLGEIGIIKIICWEKYKSNVRLSFVCGHRTLRYFQQLHDSTEIVSKKLNVPTLKIGERFPEFYENHQSLKKKYQKLYEKEVHLEARQLIETAKNGIVHTRWENRSLQEMKDIAKIIIEFGDKIVLFNSRQDCTWIIASSSSSILNVSNFIKRTKELSGGKGGGNTIFGQWSGDMTQEALEQLQNEFQLN